LFNTHAYLNPGDDFHCPDSVCGQFSKESEDFYVFILEPNIGIVNDLLNKISCSFSGISLVSSILSIQHCSLVMLQIFGL